MVDMKTLSKDGVQLALEKAHRYRLLNEPSDAESICRDVLAVESDNKEALISLLLALTDQIEDRSDAVAKAREVLPRLTSEYERAYYAESSRSGGARPSSSAARPASARSCTTRFRRRWPSTRRPSRCGPPAMTTPSFAGTPARGSSSNTIPSLQRFTTTSSPRSSRVASGSDDLV